LYDFDLIFCYLTELVIGDLAETVERFLAAKAAEVVVRRSTLLLASLHSVGH
jgi:hypothetical protein